MNNPLGIITIVVHTYGIFLCYAYHDYQDEKPKDEKSPIDVIIKDLKHSEFLNLYFSLLVHFISLFTPPMDSYFFHTICHFGVFVTNFFVTSWLVSLYIHYVYLFYPDQFQSINIPSMRWKCLVWKFLLTFLNISLRYHS